MLPSTNLADIGFNSGPTIAETMITIVMYLCYFSYKSRVPWIYFKLLIQKNKPVELFSRQ